MLLWLQASHVFNALPLFRILASCRQLPPAFATCAGPWLGSFSNRWDLGYDGALVICSSVGLNPSKTFQNHYISNKFKQTSNESLLAHSSISWNGCCMGPTRSSFRWEPFPPPRASRGMPMVCPCSDCNHFWGACEYRHVRDMYWSQGNIVIWRLVTFCFLVAHIETADLQQVCHPSAVKAHARQGTVHPAPPHESHCRGSCLSFAPPILGASYKCSKRNHLS